jgi:hypothetical protein
MFVITLWTNQDVEFVALSSCQLLQSDALLTVQLQQEKYALPAILCHLEQLVLLLESGY